MRKKTKCKCKYAAGTEAIIMPPDGSKTDCTLTGRTGKSKNYEGDITYEVRIPKLLGFDHVCLFIAQRWLRILTKA